MGEALAIKEGTLYSYLQLRAVCVCVYEKEKPLKNTTGANSGDEGGLKS